MASYSRTLTLQLLVSVVLISCYPQVDSSSDSRNYQNGIVSSAHPLASQAGLDILKKGGNAFDAAVAVAAALNVVEPMMSGMGGYGTILVYDAQKREVRFLDSSGKIPLTTNSDLMRSPTPDYMENRRGAKSISTPGNVNAWDAMSSLYGNLEWGELFDPAIDLARNGFEVSDRLEAMIASAYDDFPGYAKSFYGNADGPIKAGEKLIQADLANSFEKLAEGGREVFYEGEIADQIGLEMKKRGSFLSAIDLNQDLAEWWEPIKIDYKGYEIFTASPPANSFPALIRIGLMDQFDHLDLQHNSTEYLHIFAEITKHAFWCRLRYAGDPDISPPPLGRLLSKEYLSTVVNDISPDTATDFVPPSTFGGDGLNTTHFVVADKWGNIVSATQTLGNLFGSRVMPEGTGIWMNNSLAYCTYEPKGNPMDAHPGQRKLSGDCPVIIFSNGSPWAALGTPGGHTIPQTVPQMIFNMIDFGMDIDAAIQAPRISFVEPNTLAIEEGISKEIVNQLAGMGHQIREVRALGNAHGISFHLSDGTVMLKGSADRRGGGSVAGY